MCESFFVEHMYGHRCTLRCPKRNNKDQLIYQPLL